MERKKNNQNDGKVHYQKVTGGSLYFNRRRIVKGMDFWAYPNQIPESFKKQLAVLGDEGTAAKVEEAKVEKESPGYQLQHRGAGWWDVVDKFGKKINDDAMRKADAEKFLNELDA